MTSIDDKVINRRVLVDWDGDNFMNEGVPQSTPPNLFPNALYTSRTYLKGFDSSFVNSYYTDYVDTDNRGLLKRSIRLGDQATSIRFMWDDYKKFQPHVGDPTNLITGSVNAQGHNGYYLTSNGTVLVPEKPDNDNGLVGNYIYHNTTFSGFALGVNATVSGTQHRIDQNGWADMPELYSQQIFYNSTAVSYGGFPAIVAGQTYTLVFYVYQPKYFLANGYTTVACQPRIYTNGGAAGNPTFGRQYVAGTDIVLTPNTWTPLRYVFTAPAGATAFYIDMQFINASIASVGQYFGGIMLFDGTVSLPTRFWDTGITYQETQFTYAYPGDSATYTLSYWVRSTNGITKLTPTKHVVNIGSNTITDTALTAITVTSDWQRVDMQVAGSTSKRGVWLTFTAEKSGVPVDASHAGDVEFSGFMIVSGTSLYPYHAGELYGYDDITDYVLHVSTKNGKTNFLDELPSEGQAEFSLNNADLRFSPSNTASPLYGYLKPNLKVKIQVQNGSTWEDIWSGWTYQFDVVPGTSQTLEASLSCQQGLYRLAEGSLIVPVQTNTTMDVLAKAIIENSGWRAPRVAMQSFVGLRTRVGSNAYTQDTSQLYTQVDEGVNIIEVSGRDWSQQTDPRKALGDTLESENAQLYINRDGTISIYNRNHWVEADVTDTFSLDTTVNKAEYEYGTDIINAVEVTIVKNKQLQNQVVWETKRPVKLSADQTWVIELNPTFSEGLHKTVIEYTLDGMTKSVYNKDPGIKTDTSGASATQAEADNIGIELLGEAGARPKLRIVNRNKVVLWVALTIKGDYLETGNGEITRVEDQDSIEDVQGRHLSTYSSKVLTTEAQAESYGDFLMQHKAQARGDFTSFSITVRNQADLDRVLALSVGDIVILSETQSAESQQYHAIIGEDFVFSDSHTLTVTYYAARSLSEEIYRADTSVVELEYENYIPLDMQLNSKPANGGTFTQDLWQQEGLDRIMVWRTGVGALNKLVLAPTRDQLQVFYPMTGLQQHPTTDSTGAAVTNKIIATNYRSYDLIGYFGGQMPTGQDVLALLTFVSPYYQNANLSNIRVLLGANFLDGRDAAVSLVGSKFYTTIPVLPGAKYITRYSVSPNQGSAKLYAFATSMSGATHMSQWTGTSAHTGGTSFTQEIGQYNQHTDISWRARPNGANQDDVSSVGFKLFDGGTILFPHLPINLQNLRYSDYAKVGGVALDTATSHKYTLYARTDVDSVAVSYTLTVIAEDGSTIGTQAQTVSNTAVTKFEVNIPSGNKSAWAYLQKTTDDYLDAKVYIYGFGITDATVADYTDLIVPRDRQKVYA